MNEWEIKYVWHDSQVAFIMADTLPQALERFRDANPEVPTIALYSIICIG